MKNPICTYILDGHKPVLEKDLHQWCVWFKKADRRVDKSLFEHETIKVSTVFLGIDSSYPRKLELFETKIFGGELDAYTTRCATWDEAVNMHNKACSEVKLALR